METEVEQWVIFAQHTCFNKDFIIRLAKERSLILTSGVTEIVSAHLFLWSHCVIKLVFIEVIEVTIIVKCAICASYNIVIKLREYEHCF